MKNIFRKMRKFNWTEVPTCKKCNGTGTSEKPISVYWKGTLVDVCPSCRGRGMQAI